MIGLRNFQLFDSSSEISNLKDLMSLVNLKQDSMSNFYYSYTTEGLDFKAELATDISFMDTCLQFFVFFQSWS